MWLCSEDVSMPDKPASTIKQLPDVPRDRLQSEARPEWRLGNVFADVHVVSPAGVPVAGSCSSQPADSLCLGKCDEVCNDTFKASQTEQLSRVSSTPQCMGRSPRARLSIPCTVCSSNASVTVAFACGGRHAAGPHIVQAASSAKPLEAPAPLCRGFRGGRLVPVS